MKIQLRRVTLPLLASVLLPLTIPSIALADDCDRDSQSFLIKVRVKGGAPVAVMRGNQPVDDLHVCIGDTVEWRLQGQARRFFISFAGDAPFAGGKMQNSNNGKILVTIGGSARRGASYKYDVGLDGGGVLDPRIIVD
ncbi:MAG: hypothetical protein BMS9Abin32_139 [Gammaproteobacteria bacterium]|nr:MAG: hypothetical protein BMS9Abin32_139 [Gammaproteobacteria bacterium]